MREELVAVLNDAIVEAGKVLDQFARTLTVHRTISSRPAQGPLQSPLQRAHDTVVVDRREPGLPIVHPLAVTRAHECSSVIATNCVASSVTASKCACGLAKCQML